MSQRSFVQSQILETARLLELAGDHPLMSPGLRTRKAALEAELQNLLPDEPEARAVLFFTGAPVFGSVGIDAEFAGRVLDPFTRMVKSQYAAKKHGTEGARGPRRDEFESKLMLTALPRGSFGLELTQPPQHEKPESTRMVGEVLQQLSGLIESSAENDDVFADAVREVSSRTLVALRDLLGVMVDRQAGFRLVTGEREVELGRAAMTRAFERVNITVSAVRELRIAGVSRGLTLESWRFDFRSDEGDVISGRIAEEVEDAKASAMARLTDEPCVAVMRVTTIAKRDGRVSIQHELVDMVAAAPASANVR